MLRISIISGLLCVVMRWAATPAAAQVPAELPRVLIIATGGTIAGAQGEPGTLGGYDIRKPINEIVAEVPEARKFAQIETVQFANIPSAYITPDQWLQLARTINSALDKRPQLPGI